MSAVAAIAVFALLFALFGALAAARGSAKGCHTCKEGDPERCGSCPFGKDALESEEVEIR